MERKREALKLQQAAATREKRIIFIRRVEESGESSRQSQESFLLLFKVEK